MAPQMSSPTSSSRCSSPPPPPPPPSSSPPPPPPPPMSPSSMDMIERNRSLIEPPPPSSLLDDKYSIMAQQSAEAWLMRKDTSCSSIMASTAAALYLNDENTSPYIELKSPAVSPNKRQSLRERLQERLLVYSSSDSSSNRAQQQPHESSNNVDIFSNHRQDHAKDETLFDDHDDDDDDDDDDDSSSASSGLCQPPSSFPSSQYNNNTTTTTSPRISPGGRRNNNKKNLIIPTMFRLSQRFRASSRQPTKFNIVKLHIYDLMASETVMQLPWGCHFPIGKCLSAVNDGLHALGTGAYHCGVEVNGIEYAFGANEMEGLSGVFTCIPKHSPGYEYRTTLDFGRRETVKRSWIKVPKVELVEVPYNERRAPTIEVNAGSVYREYETFLHGHAVMREMAREYMGCDYDLLKRNCCTFAKDACLRLGVQQSEIPTWFLNLADAGAVTKDMAESSLKPLQNMLSFNEVAHSEVGSSAAAAIPATPIDRGFEVICHEKQRTDTEDSTEMEIVRVVESSSNVRRTLSCRY